MKLDVAHVSVPMVGEIANGDRVIHRTDGARRTLLAVIDALGHGPGAASVADLAAQHLNQVSLESSVFELMRGLHEALAGSRGAAATVCLLNGADIELCAVGNVELRSGDVRLPLVSSAGVLGGRVNKFHICRASLPGRCRLVVFSDGISSRVPLDDFRGVAPRAACDAIVKRYRRREDDSTILIADLE
jgi:hypothetical protein